MRHRLVSGHTGTEHACSCSARRPHPAILTRIRCLSGLSGSVSDPTPIAPPASTSSSIETVLGQWTGAWVGFFFISIASSQCSLIVRYVALPLITGYMFFGVLVGPQILAMVSPTDLGHLVPITQFALAFISMSAGAELYLPELRALFRRILLITSSVTVVCFIVCLFVVYGLARVGLVPFMEVLPGSCQFSISLIAASVMVTQSPASAIAVVAETKSKGPFTSTMVWREAEKSQRAGRDQPRPALLTVVSVVHALLCSAQLGITVLTDIVVLLLYSVCSSVANANCSETAEGFKILDLGVTIGCVLSAIIIGYAFGKIIIFLLWVPRMHGEWLVLPLGFACFRSAAWFTEFSTEEYGHGINFDPLLICITAGYIVANQSRNRRKFLRFMGSLGPLVFIPFFTLTGCGLNLKVMGQSAGFAFIVFATRALTFLVGTQWAGRATGMDALQLRTLWLSMLTQAGVSLGIAAEVAIAFRAWGKDFQSTMVAVILINQIVGPVLCKWALRKNGEDGLALGDDSDDEDEKPHKRAMIIGINISSLAVAQRLLKADWNVLFIDTDARKTDMLQWLQYERRKLKVLSAKELAAKKARREARAAARLKRKTSLLSLGVVSKAEMDKAVADAVARVEAGEAAEQPAVIDVGASADAPPSPSGTALSTRSPPPSGRGRAPSIAVEAIAEGEEGHHQEDGPPVDQRKLLGAGAGAGASDAVEEQKSSGGAGGSSGSGSTPAIEEARRAARLKRELARHAEMAAKAAEAAASSTGSGDINTTTDLNATTTAPVELQVQFRLLAPTSEPIDPKDLCARYTNASSCVALRSLCSDLSLKNLNAALVMLESDELNFELCSVLQECLGLTRIVAEIQNPNWTSLFAQMGVLTLFPYSLASHTLAALVMSSDHGHGRFELLPHNKPLHVGLSQVIRPDTVVDGPPLYLRHLSPEEQRAWSAQHPEPLQPKSGMWQFNEKLRVVPAAVRDDYLAQLRSLHSNNAIKLDHSSSMAAADLTFQGPGMLSITDGADGDGEGDGDAAAERKETEINFSPRRANSLRTPAERLRERRASKADQEEEL